MANLHKKVHFIYKSVLVFLSILIFIAAISIDPANAMYALVACATSVLWILMDDIERIVEKVVVYFHHKEGKSR